MSSNEVQGWAKELTLGCVNQPTLLLDVVEWRDADLGRGRRHPRGEVAGKVDEDEVQGDGRGQEQRPGGSEQLSFSACLYYLHFLNFDLKDI